MEIDAYYRSVTDELAALKDRVHNFIGDKHWQSVGEWKESVLRAVLRRHLPASIALGRGFVVGHGWQSSQLDLLLYDCNAPTLFRDGDFVILTADAVWGVIEVKTRLSGGELSKALKKLCSTAEKIRGNSGKDEIKRLLHQEPDQGFGLFVYDANVRGINSKDVAQLACESCEGHWARIINCISIGKSAFVRFWPRRPSCYNQPHDFWRSYDLPQTAQAYFVANVVEAMCPRSVESNSPLWYPPDGKEPYLVGEDVIFDPPLGKPNAASSNVSR